MENVWQILSREPKVPDGVMTDAFIMRFDTRMDFVLLSENYVFGPELLRIYQHRVVWASVLRKSQYPESFLREMVPNFHDCWFIVCKYQRLSEAFIHDYADRVDWEYVQKYQHVSREFLQRHREYLISNSYDAEAVADQH